MGKNTLNRNRIRRTIKSTTCRVVCIKGDDTHAPVEIRTITLPSWYSTDGRLISAIRRHLAKEGYAFIKPYTPETERRYAVYEMTNDEFLEKAHLVEEYDEGQEELWAEPEEEEH